MTTDLSREAPVSLPDEFPDGIKLLILFEMHFPPKVHEHRCTTTKLESLCQDAIQDPRHPLRSVFQNVRPGISVRNKPETMDGKLEDLLKAGPGSEYEEMFMTRVLGKTFFLTEQGYLGVAKNINLEDEVWLITGSNVPTML